MKTAIVTSYFNPCGYKTRLANYRLFRSQLPAPLLTVYLDFSDAHELTASDADLFLRLQGNKERNVLWQKETLLNIGARMLPASVENIIFLDADILIPDPDWLSKVESALEKSLFVQPYSECVRLPEGADASEYPTKALPFGWDVDEVQPAYLNHPQVRNANGRPVRGHPGFAFAVKREVLDQVSLYELCISGAGDSVLVSASLGRLASFDWTYSPLHYCHLQRWFKQWSSLVAGRTGIIEDSRILHLYHGTKANRQYQDRYKKVFAGHRFNPDKDITKDANGLLSWIGPADVYERIKAYFDSRKEDG